MAWAEWEQLKADAAVRNGAQMQLNKAGPTSGGSKQGDLAVNQTDLSAVRDEASKLHGRLWKEARVAGPPARRQQATSPPKASNSAEPSSTWRTGGTNSSSPSSMPADTYRTSPPRT